MNKLRSAISQIYFFFRRRPFLFALLLVSIVLSIAYILRLLTPDQSTVQSIPLPKFSTTPATKANYNFTTTPIVSPPTYPQVPPTLLVYSSASRVITLESLLTTFDLSTTEYADHYENKSLRRSLVYDPSGQRYNYNDSKLVGETDEAYSSRIDESAAIQTATQFTHDILRLAEYNPNTNAIKFYSKIPGEDAELSSKDEANIIEVPFNIILNEREAYFESNVLAPLFVYVDSTNKVTGFSLYKNLFTTGNGVSVKTISPDKIVEYIRSGNAEVVHMYGSDARQFKLQNMKEIKISEIAIQYRYIASSQMTIPYFYVFSQVTFAENLPVLKIEFALPAVVTSAKQ